MRATVRDTAGRRYYILRSCVRASDPPLADAGAAAAGARRYSVLVMQTLCAECYLHIHDTLPGGCVVIFVALDAYKAAGGAEAGFLKTLKRRTHTAFVHGTGTPTRSTRQRERGEGGEREREGGSGQCG